MQFSPELAISATSLDAVFATKWNGDSAPHQSHYELYITAAGTIWTHEVRL
jgi:hypothetical protein